MKTTLVTCLSSLALACSLFAQTPALSPDVTASASASIAPTAVPAATAPVPAGVPAVASSPSNGEDLEARIERKAKRGVNITFGDDDRRERKADRRDRDRDEVHVNGPDFDEGALMAIPIVGIIFTTLFGAPVLIVGVIMFFSYWKARSLHRTVRMMVEKGQPVPEALFATPASPVRQRNDMRRGVILTMVGFGVMIFFGAMDDWDGGAWAVGIIPFLIGAGYLLVWKLEQNKAGTDNPMRLS